MFNHCLEQWTFNGKYFSKDPNIQKRKEKGKYAVDLYLWTMG